MSDPPRKKKGGLLKGLFRPLLPKSRSSTSIDKAGTLSPSQVVGSAPQSTVTTGNDPPTTTVNISGGKFYKAENMAIHNTSNTQNVLVQGSTQEERLYIRLQPSVRADYKYGLTSGEKKKVSRDLCTPGTRRRVLQDIINWVEDNSDAQNNLFLLCGPAGSGKSTIAYTTAHLFDPTTKKHVKTAMKLDQFPSQRVNLAANFFCSRHFEETSRVSAIIRTIAYQFALKYKPFADALQNFEATDHGVESQFELLLLKPCRLLNLEGQIIIIEAIDELGIEDSHLFLESLIKCLEHDPPRGLKFIVTSREEGGLIKLTDSLPQKRLYRLQDVDKAEVEDDIRTYLSAILPDVDETEREKAVAYSDGLFVCAATIARYLEPYRRTPKIRNLKLRTLLAKLSESSQGLDAMDDLYRQIIQDALQELQDDADLLSDYLSILHAFLCTLIPTTPSTVATLANISDVPERDALLSEIAADVLHRLHAVLYADGEGNVLPYHKSLPDFIFDQHRAGQYHCDRPSFNTRITTSCLRIMHKELRFNIAEIDTSYRLDEAISDLPQRVAANVSPSLAYAAQHWSHHLDATEATALSPFHHSLSLFLQIKALFWIEVMNLLGHQARCDDLLRKARDWVLRCIPLNPNSKLAQQLFEIASFALYFAASPASASTPHLYISVLATWPRNDDLPSTWRRWFPNIPRLEYRGELNRTLVHIDVGSRVNSAAISNDGTRIVSGSEDGMVRIWDAATGKPVLELEGHTGGVTSVGFSCNGAHVISGSSDTTVRIWDVSTGKLVVKLEGHAEDVQSVAFSNDATRAVSGSTDNSVRIWDVSTGTLVAKLLGHTNRVTSVAWSSDGAHVVSGSWDGTVRIWDVSKGTLVVKLKGHTGWVCCVAFSSDGTRVVSCSDDTSVGVWDVRTGKLVVKLEGHSFDVLSVAFSSDGTRVVSASFVDVWIWDLSRGEVMVKLKGHTNAVQSVMFSSDGTRVVSGSEDNSARIWDVSTRELAVNLEGHTDSVTSVAISNDGTRVVSGSDDKSIRAWDALTGRLITKLTGHTSEVNSVAFSNDGTLVASGSNDTSVRIWNLSTSTLVATMEGHTIWVTSVAFSPDGSILVSGSGDKTVRIWSVPTAKLVFKLDGHTECVRCVSFSYDGSSVVSGSDDRSVRIWDVLTGNLATKLEGHTAYVFSVAFSPDGTRVMSGSADASVRIWDVLTGMLVVKLEGLTSWVRSVAFSNDGTRVVAGCNDKSIRIWDVSEEKLVAKLKDHTRQVSSVAFSSDGTRVVSGSWDNSVRIWDVHQPVPPYTLQHASPDSDPTGWLLSPETPNKHLMYVPPSACLVYHPAILCISRTPHSVLSPFKYDYLGENWTKCYVPQPPEV